MEGRWKLAQFLACSFLSLTKPFFPHPLSCHLPAGVSSYIPSLHQSINPPPPQPAPFSSPSHHQPHPFTLYGLLPCRKSSRVVFISEHNHIILIPQYQSLPLPPPSFLTHSSPRVHMIYPNSTWPGTINPPFPVTSLPGCCIAVPIDLPLYISIQTECCTPGK